MKANVKKHVIIASLSAVCVAMVCVIAAQFNTKLPTAEKVDETTTTPEIKVAITTNPKEEKIVITDNSKDVSVNTITETEVITSEIQHKDFVESGGIEIDQSFAEATKVHMQRYDYRNVAAYNTLMRYGRRIISRFNCGQSSGITVDVFCNGERRNSHKSILQKKS